MNKNMPLSIMLENVKGEITTTCRKIMQESGVPAYLMEGIVVGILADVRNQKALELAADYNSVNQNQTDRKPTPESTTDETGG